jgi:biopolymer transport protein ExbB
MITFAAIALQGDVNVNAIAPGIAAALAATVAGLIVAIPALFGYNYLLSQVKEITSDMHVFIDEFVTKIAEYYGGRGTNGKGQHSAESEGMELEMIA